MVFTGCENELNRTVKFKVTPETPDGIIKETAFTVNVGTPIKFNFTGDPDFITFYSGEPGSEYSKRNLLEIPADEITSVLKFSNKPQYGVIPNTLKLYFSTEFTGLTQDKKKDSLAIVNHQWINVDSLANFSIKSNTVNESEIPLDKYLGKRLTLAFKYDPGQNGATQPTWEITHLRIENTLKSTQTTSVLNAKAIGFTPMDMLASDKIYVSDSKSGVWNLKKIGDKKSEIRIQSTPSGAPINEDWLISNPILINSRPADTGIAIKGIASDLNYHTYTFSKPGTYTVTFVAKNTNYVHNSEIIKEFTVTVN